MHETAGAASSAAVEAPQFTQYDGWDEQGNPVVSEQPKVADAAPANKVEEETTEDGPEAESGKPEKQEEKPQEKRRKPDAEARIRELAAETKRLKAELEEAKKGKETKPAESSTAKPNEAKAAPTETRPKPKLDDTTPTGEKKYANYEEWQDAIADWRVEQKFAEREQNQRLQAAQQTLAKQLDEARGRYTDFNEVTNPLISDLMKPEIPREVRDVIQQSPVLADLLYTIGGTEATKSDFLDACRNNPGKALRVALLMEQEIAKELGTAKPAAEKAGEGEGKATPVAVKPRAPKPPSEVGGRGAPPEDAALVAAKNNDFRSFEAELTRRALAARR